MDRFREENRTHPYIIRNQVKPGLLKWFISLDGQLTLNQLPYLQHNSYNSRYSGPLAQLVEQGTLNALVLGSSPRRLTTYSPLSIIVLKSKSLRLLKRYFVSSILGLLFSQATAPTELLVIQDVWGLSLCLLAANIAIHSWGLAPSRLSQTVTEVTP